MEVSKIARYTTRKIINLKIPCTLHHSEPCSMRGPQEGTPVEPLDHQCSREEGREEGREGGSREGEGLTCLNYEWKIKKKI